jgi:hypothetical protein
VHEDKLPDFSDLQHDPRFDFWTRPQIGDNNLVMTSANDTESLIEALHVLDLDHQVYIVDVGP